MIARSMFAFVALLTLTASPTALGDPPEAKGPLKLKEKKYTDDAGNTLETRFEGADGNTVQVKVTDKQGKPVKVVEIPLKDMTVCVPKAGAVTVAGGKEPTPLCQPLASVSDGAFIKMGTATCTCQVYSGRAYCYGDTCP